MKFTCRYCKDFLGVHLLKVKSYSSALGNGVCKPCHNERSRNTQLEARIDKNPENYVQCNDCDSYTYKYTSNGNSVNNWKKKVVTKCRHCLGSNIEDVI
jgi:hypothetical protein